MARRLPSTPPNLPGFAYIRPLGSGGFADVFLYEQSLPQRLVAVKVLQAGIVTDQVRQMFRAETNLMARFSSHPSILTVFQSSMSADGRPYLVMEYCSSTLSQKYRKAPLAVPEVLRIGVRIASAVETAHRAGVLHRDIKPSNILVTAYGHAVLSDFGIASTLSDAEKAHAVGLSIPWSAPEVLRDSVSGSIASEVWSLGATLYSLLAGRSPFEVHGTENSTAELTARIMRAVVPPLGRVDVPARLEEVLRRSMSRSPQSRQHSVLELIRELQSAEAELGLAQTPLEVCQDEWASAIAADPDEHTRITPPSGVEPSGRRRRAPTVLGRTIQRGGKPDRDGPVSHGALAASVSATRPPRSRRRVGALWSLAAAAVLLVGGTATGATVILTQVDSDIPIVTTLTGAALNGTVLFQWTDPGIRDGDSFVVSLGSGETSIQRGTEFAVEPGRSAEVCLIVSVNRAGQNGQPSREACVSMSRDDR
ncbi:MAG: serine/threonine-protein kinase [Cryobacterium sp.]